MTDLRGKGVWLWQVERCEGGDAARIAARAAAAGLSHVLVKVCDGSETRNDKYLGDLAEALRARGLAVWGWGYTRPSSPQSEALTAAAQVQRYGLAGFVIDAESEYQAHLYRTSRARAYVAALRAALPDTPLALSTYRYPSLHRPFPFGAFLEKCDLQMPQVYWEQAHNPGDQVRRSRREWAALGYQPYLPTGSAYGAGKWEATGAEVCEFLTVCRDEGYPGANLWSWDYAGRPDKAYLWREIERFDWPTPVQPIPPAPVPPPPTEWHWPTDFRVVTQKFGANPATYKAYGLPGHEGLDVRAPHGSNVYAVHAGRVHQIDQNHRYYGVSVRLRFEAGGVNYEATVGHGLPGSVRVEVGQTVRAGDVLMLADNTGNVLAGSSHCHLHLKRLDGGPGDQGFPYGLVDPERFLKV